MKQYEVEVKVLLGKESIAKQIMNQIIENEPNCRLIDQNNQLNHYFLRDGNYECLFQKISSLTPSDKIESLKYILFEGKNHSIRTRWKDGDVIFVVKAVADDTNAENGIARLEFETNIEGIKIDELDQIILDCGFSYQSKWSRSRKEFKYKDFNICFDKNAGYGYICEFEKVINDENQINEAKKEILDELEHLGLEELDQSRLDRMFKYYNENWKEYYGTEKTFIIE